MCPPIHRDLFRDVPFNEAKLIVTARGLYRGKKARQALRRILPYARIHSTGFRSVYLIETFGNVFTVAEKICQVCLREIGHATAIVEEVPTDINYIKESAILIGTHLINEDQSYCIRVKKRGKFLEETNIPQLESEIGSGVWEALKIKYGKEPHVDLENPDVKIIAEVLGHMTAIGVQLKSWFDISVEKDMTGSQPFNHEYQRK